MKILSTKLGFFLLVISVMGLILMAALPWFEVRNGEKETYLLNEFGKRFKDDFGDEYDEYYSGSAYLGMCGLAILLVLSLFIIIPFLRNLLSKPKLIAESSAERRGTLLGALLFIPATLIMLSGSRFVGFISTLNAQANANNAHLTYSSGAGWAMFIIGIIILVLAILIVLRNMAKSKISQFSFLIAIICVIGLISMPLLTFMKVEYRVNAGYGEYQVERKVTQYVNDGDIYVYAKGSQPSELRHVFEKMSGDMTLIGVCFVLGMLFSLLAFAGIQLNTKYTNIMVSLGCLTLILCLLIFIGYILFVSHVVELNDVYGRIYGRTAGVFSVVAAFGSNNIPLLMGALGAIISLIYCLEAYPKHVVKLFGRSKSSSD